MARKDSSAPVTRLKMAKIATMTSWFRAEDGARTQPLSVKETKSSIKGILEEIKTKFHKPDVIDERKRNHFVQKEMTEAPKLTDQEVTMFKSLESLEKELAEKGERVKGTAREGVDKYLWNDGGQIWGGFVVTIDTSALNLFAQLYQLATYENTRIHVRKQGASLPRKVQQSVDGSRGLHYSAGVHLPAPLQARIFQNWMSWKSEQGDANKLRYIIGLSTLDEYRGTKDEEFDRNKYTLGATKGIYVIEEVSENVCRWTRIQSADMQLSLPASVLNLLSKQLLKKANEVQEKYRRNGKVVDKEVRDVLVEIMRQGVEPRDDQKKIFKEVRRDETRSKGRENPSLSLNLSSGLSRSQKKRDLYIKKLERNSEPEDDSKPGKTTTFKSAQSNPIVLLTFSERFALTTCSWTISSGRTKDGSTWSHLTQASKCKPSASSMRGGREASLSEGPRRWQTAQRRRLVLGTSNITPTSGRGTALNAATLLVWSFKEPGRQTKNCSQVSNLSDTLSEIENSSSSN